jgi:Cu(I)/Ag(I) efflux system membrane protein CusA/SilA
MIVVSLIIFLFLMHVRSALVAVITLPVAVLLAFIPMFYQKLTINIMSLGGIAVAIGAMVDASIIIVENVHRRLEEWEDEGRPISRTSAVATAITEVGPSIFFSLVVIAVSFLPVFTLQATEGRLFRPLAFTKTYSMGFAALLAVTLAPALAAILIRGRMRREEHNPLNRWLIRMYEPVVRVVVRWRYAVVVVFVVLLVATVPVFLALESEFMPPLNEGAVLAMPTSPPGMSITEAANVVQAMDRALSELPEVASVFGKMGRAETATDPAPLSMAEITIMLKPREEWRPGMTWEKLIDEMDAAVQVPGMPNLWWMPIQTRIEMLTTGIRSPLGIQVFGPDPATIERTAVEIERAVMDIPGTRSAFAERSTGGFFIDFTVKRDAAARYGLSVRDVNNIVQSAIGGMNVTQTVEGRERYPVNVRFARDWRDSPDALQRVLVQTPTGEDIPISAVADVEFVSGPPMVRSEDGQLVTFVFVDTGDRAIGDYVEEAKQVVAASVDVPPGVRLAWTGQYRYLERAMQRLSIVVPVTLLLVALLLYLIRRSVVETGIVLLTAPFALIGSVWLMWAAGFHLSVAAWVGVIALLGVAAETGVVMLLYLNLAIGRWKQEGRLQSFADLKDAIVEGAARRIRPKFMAVTTTTIGLMPLMWGTGAGADVMKRIAAPMVGGLTTSFLMELLLYPAIYAIWKARGLRG